MSDEEIMEYSSDESKPYNPNFARFMDEIERLQEKTIPDIVATINDQRQKDRKAKNRRNKRQAYFSVAVMIAFCIMWAVSMFMGKYEMAQSIIQILLAIGAGAGLASAMRD